MQTVEKNRLTSFSFHAPQRRALAVEIVFDPLARAPDATLQIGTPCTLGDFAIGEAFQRDQQRHVALVPYQSRQRPFDVRAAGLRLRQVRSVVILHPRNRRRRASERSRFRLRSVRIVYSQLRTSPPRNKCSERNARTIVSRTRSSPMLELRVSALA